jgi:hypothetical protein
VQRDERLAISFFSLLPTSKSGKYKDCGKIQIVTIIVFPLLAYNNKKKRYGKLFHGVAHQQRGQNYPAGSLR